MTDNTGGVSTYSTEARQRKSEATKQSWCDPKVRKRRTEAIRRARRTPEARLRTSEASKKAWSDPEQHERRRESISRAAANPITRKRTGEASRRAWVNPEKRERMVKAIRQAKRTPEARQQASEAITQALADPEARQRMSERSKQSWANAATRQLRLNGQRRALENPIVHQRMSDGISASWTPERRAKQSEWTKKMWAERAALLRKAGVLPQKPPKAVNRGGRPRDDEVASMIRELKARNVSWPSVKKLMDKETGVTRCETAYRNLLSRYLKRQEALHFAQGARSNEK